MTQTTTTTDSTATTAGARAHARRQHANTADTMRHIPVATAPARLAEGLPDGAADRLVWSEQLAFGRYATLHLARGTRLRLAAYRPSDLTTLILRAACDCAEHRQAGATGRVALNPGAEPLEVHELDGARVFGWHGHEAALLPLQETAGILESLLPRLTPRRTGTDQADNHAEAS